MFFFEKNGDENFSQSFSFNLGAPRISFSGMSFSNSSSNKNAATLVFPLVSVLILVDIFSHPYLLNYNLVDYILKDFYFLNRTVKMPS